MRGEEHVSRDTRIVMPTSLQQPTLAIGRERHQRFSKTKALLRSKVWWNGIDKQVEQLINNCLPCHSATSQAPKPRDPLLMSEMPDKS